ncbi:vanillin dehydrogenase [Aaosphaeria arxii CBS 175.79]|uniref:Vanillin dehydrogenase n=1 Tax=Aaosphaeria arxii CBS 175.79 TaxID=1450172 RepID=A0A6A5X793_9PLEO|nr:vanillin dehydrogenase [Aaosphaeria arxii CBS 175.79]KAF2008782.1 vanillin dehydrogenase [Aaosphaeria arxii CBS 175.79]
MAKNEQVVGSPASAFASNSVIPFWINGEEVVSESEFSLISPIDQRVLYRCSSAGTAEVSRAVESAQSAFVEWSKTKPRERRDIFLRAADEFRRRKAELRHYSLTETGASEAMFAFEHEAACQACYDVAGLIQIATTGTAPVLDAEGSSGVVLNEPFGVVLGIAPWNGPNVLGLRACLQPLAMGNTVILKGPEAAPATYWAIASILHASGLPAGCLNTLYHRPEDAAEVTSALISHPSVKKINFTGSTAVGSIIASLAGQYLKPTVMELGGKAPAIICDDADIELAAVQCCLGAFLHAGQVCMSTERIIVNAAIATEFREALKSAMVKLFGSQQTPQLVNSTAVVRNHMLISDALSNGASLLYGKLNDDYDQASTRMPPAIIENVTPRMKIYSTESFGPTVTLYIVNSDEEAIKLANDTEYGLSSAVFTADLCRALRIAKSIDSGAVHINSMTIHDETTLPHGGVKSSGFGRFNSLPGLQEWVRTKTVTWKD